MMISGINIGLTACETTIIRTGLPPKSGIVKPVREKKKNIILNFNLLISLLIFVKSHIIQAVSTRPGNSDEIPADTIPPTNTEDAKRPASGSNIFTISIALSTVIPRGKSVAAAQAIIDALTTKVSVNEIIASLFSIFQLSFVHPSSLTSVLLEIMTTEAIVVPTIPAIIK